MSWATYSVEDVFSSLDTSTDGLTQEEANQRIKEYGKNRLNPEINGSFGFKLIARLLEPNTSLLLAISAISAVSIIMNNEYPYELLVIIAIIAINAAFIVYQRSRSDTFLQNLSKKTVTYTRTLRNGEIIKISADELVPGDIVFFTKGEVISADCRVCSCEDFSVEESVIRNSESKRIFKYSAQLLGVTDNELNFSDMNNMIFSGSTVISGKCVAVVTATGLSTYIGRTFDIVSTARKNKTPLQLKLHDATNWINIFVMCVCGVVLIGQLIMAKISGGTLHFADTMDKIMVTLALSITAMPQGLSQSAGVIISNIAERMTSDNIIVGKYEKIELAGSAQVVFADLRYIENENISDIENFVLTNNDAEIITVFLSDESKNSVIEKFGNSAVVERKSQFISAEELNNLSEEDYSKQFREYRFYCGVNETDKIKITEKWKSAGYIIITTGDGHNDIIAMKNADVTVCTDNEKNDIHFSSCDVFIKKDCFSALTSVIENGRRIYDNVQKLFVYTVSNNLAELLTILIATILNFNILSTVQLLWINLVSDTFPSAALSLDKFESNLMKRRRIDIRGSIYNNGVIRKIITNGILITALTMISYFIGEVYLTGVWKFAWVTDENGAIGTTMAFITMSLSGLFNAINMRSDTVSIFITETKQNRNHLLYMNNILAIGLSVIAVRVPLIADIFGFVRITWFQYGTAIAIALLILPVNEIIKLTKRYCLIKTNMVK